MQHPIETIEHKEHTIKIYQDDDPMNPREWDNLGKMVCFHKRYSLGDKHDLHSNDYTGWDEMRAHIEREHNAVVIPLHLYDHSGITMQVGAFSDPWDSGQVGFIFAPRADVLAEYKRKRITPTLRADVETRLRGEVAVYDQFLRGDVYGYVVEGPVCDDSVCGYHGIDGVLDEAKAAIDYAVRHHIETESAIAMARSL